jgi:acetyl-CoA synthetase
MFSIIEENDMYWCTADIGWITGHSYILYGPLLNGATTVIFEGVPSYPDFSRFWEVIEKHKVTQFYTAPTAIRALAKESLDYVQRFPLSSLKVIGSVGEPINEEAWHWYNDHVGGKRCPLSRYVVANRNRRNYDFASTVCNTNKTNVCFIAITRNSTCFNG